MHASNDYAAWGGAGGFTYLRLSAVTRKPAGSSGFLFYLHAAPQAKNLHQQQGRACGLIVQCDLFALIKRRVMWPIVGSMNYASSHIRLTY